ncbi:MAG TPA: motility protein A [Firmicutes bacterium]|uniref:motility protein A n=1 Tax=Gelria sp. Kuro-4 TaxID=2796927 RepID=UPI00199EF7DA|nr:MotA/TolQ/ExbB proton channel family protein [Gelria sp. Kuro-4]MDI3521879.1 chemotaxis protein MotA [Bacillota bacterium]MDK2926549.1 chemotaxis protein MotA [Bacillota bacterium]BCV24930.1 motility protein A [Gelria sp. Kuro-4]HHV56206.1 motility protein A [Bacillota bacterium]
MDIGTVIGIISGVALILIAVSSTGSLLTYWDVPSLMITMGGTIAGTLIAYPLSQIVGVLKVVRNVLQRRLPSPETMIQRLVYFTEKARREGILALEDEVETLDDEFFKKGLQLVVDGSDPELVRNILETELAFVEERHKSGQGIFITMATLAPAFGMIGTLIGLINMLKHLDDPAVIGPNMAVALITTFYGALFANLICIPIASKLNIRSGQEVLLKELVIEGVLSLQAGENPRLVEEKLKAFLPPKARNALNARQGAQVGG